MSSEIFKKISPALFVAEFILVIAVALSFYYFSMQPEVNIPNYFLEQLHAAPVEPNALLERYPNLLVNDFQNVMANGGKYIIQSGKVTFAPDRNKRDLGNNEGISESGSKVLLKNLNKRLGLSIDSYQDIDNLITKLAEQKTIKVTKTQTIVGEYICVPPKSNTSTEIGCVQGVKTNSTTYYALDLAPLENIAVMRTGDQIRVAGEMVPVETLSSDKWQKYPIKGIFRAVTIEKVE
jgi:hypothetical protein